MQTEEIELHKVEFNEIHGIIVEILKEFQTIFNVKIALVRTADTNWDRMVKMIGRGRVDLGAATLTNALYR